MARLPQLVDALTATDGRDRATIDNVARAIREDGLLPTTLRGPGASKMTAANAADLLIATSMPVPRGEASAAAIRFRALEPHTLSLNRTESPTLQAVAQSASLGEAVEVLIQHARAIDNEFAALARAAAARTGRHVFPELRVAFKLTTWSQSAQIFRIMDSDDGVPPELIAEFRRDDVRKLLDRDRTDRLLETGVSFGLPTLLALHCALYEGTDE